VTSGTGSFPACCSAIPGERLPAPVPDDGVDAPLRFEDFFIPGGREVTAGGDAAGEAGFPQGFNKPEVDRCPALEGHGAGDDVGAEFPDLS
jgi:hypothetical protein